MFATQDSVQMSAHVASSGKNYCIAGQMYYKTSIIVVGGQIGELIMGRITAGRQREENMYGVNDYKATITTRNFVYLSTKIVRLRP